MISQSDSLITYEDALLSFAISDFIFDAALTYTFLVGTRGAFSELASCEINKNTGEVNFSHGLSRGEYASQIHAKTAGDEIVSVLPSPPVIVHPTIK